MHAVLKDLSSAAKDGFRQGLWDYFHPIASWRILMKGAHVIKYLPAIVDDEGEPYDRIPVRSFQHMRRIDWISKWEDRDDPEFSFVDWRQTTDRFSSYAVDGIEPLWKPDVTHGCLWAVMRRKKLLHAHLVAFVSDHAMIAHLPECKRNSLGIVE